jgi:hypothetical protein
MLFTLGPWEVSLFKKKQSVEILSSKYVSPIQADNKADKILVKVLDVVEAAMNRGEFELGDVEGISAGLIVVGLRAGEKQRVRNKINSVDKQLNRIMQIIKIRKELEIQNQIHIHVKELESKIEELTSASTKSQKN